jgi:hypothetical protein
VIPGGSPNGSAAYSRLLVTAPARSRVRGLNSANEGSGSSWSRFCIPGGQGVAGSNPAVPTDVPAGQKADPKFTVGLLPFWEPRSKVVQPS